MTFKSCLIGYTGFVGSTLLRQRGFQYLLNSTNVDQVDTLPDLDLIVCAAAPGSMLEANRSPDRDRQRLEGLMTRLSALRSRRFVLISSIAVLSDFAAGFDEDNARFQTELAYGRHRRALEEFCEDHFEDCLILRLPALFGTGLRKNFIFDLLNPVPSMLSAPRMQAEFPATELLEFYQHDTETGMYRLDRAQFDADPRRAHLERDVVEAGFAATEFHNPETTYQYYDMARLSDDIDRAFETGLKTVHLATEPLRAGQIHERLLKRPMPDTGARLHQEDMRTRHAPIWGRKSPYLDDASTVLDRLEAFFLAERARRA